MNEFQTIRLDAKPLSLDDFAELAVLHKDVEVSKFLGGVRDEAATHRYITDNIAHWNEYGFGTWALRDKAGTFAGRCALRHITINDVDEVEIGYTFHRAFWGQGLATEVSRKVLEIGFGPLALPNIIAFASVEHKASRHVMEKLGFRFEVEREIKGDLCAVYRLQAP
ncbi:MAG: GNAT family N-acetyltransferase [Parvibaculum sp.]|uniref:GNAT family N-acetyltransferase n=1 Tax=Parvibaculum sp. TaxID=2024848 RepID=UPI0025E89249|nr:GNAT family N-acetyltransferase [Parvibaculum sp.]MCE9650761.1 GNAT family N-acetyltransferase [Parvibaculum sp.]